MKTFKTIYGFSLVEMIIYVSLVFVISIVVINSILSFTGSYRDLRALRNLDHSSVDAMERMTRDISAATNIDITHSTFGSSPGALTLVQTSSSISTTTKFYIQSNVLRVDVNGVYFGPLTTSAVSVTNLTFFRLTSGFSEAVRVNMTLLSTDGTISKSKTYHSTIILH